MAVAYQLTIHSPIFISGNYIGRSCRLPTRSSLSLTKTSVLLSCPGTQANVCRPMQSKGRLFAPRMSVASSKWKPTKFTRMRAKSTSTYPFATEPCYLSESSVEPISSAKPAPNTLNYARFACNRYSTMPQDELSLHRAGRK